VINRRYQRSRFRYYPKLVSCSVGFKLTSYKNAFSFRRPSLELFAMRFLKEGDCQRLTTTEESFTACLRRRGSYRRFYGGTWQAFPCARERRNYAAVLAKDVGALAITKRRTRVIILHELLQSRQLRGQREADENDIAKSQALGKAFEKMQALRQCQLIA
jgi:hypothetical protein